VLAAAALQIGGISGPFRLCSSRAPDGDKAVMGIGGRYEIRNVIQPEKTSGWLLPFRD
jgi:hypothetical protein